MRHTRQHHWGPFTVKQQQEQNKSARVKLPFFRHICSDSSITSSCSHHSDVWLFSVTRRYLPLLHWHQARVTAHLLSVLFEESQLEALVQLQLPDVPHLMEVLPGGVQLVQQTGHLAGSKTAEVFLLMPHQSWSCVLPVGLFSSPISRETCLVHGRKVERRWTVFIVFKNQWYMTAAVFKPLRHVLHLRYHFIHYFF